MPMSRATMAILSYLLLLTLPASLGCSSRCWAAGLEWRTEQGTFDSERGSILYGVSNEADVLITIDPETGTGTEVGPLAVDIGNEGINFHPDGTLYGLFWNVDSSDYRLYTVDLESGAATEVGPLNLGLIEQGTDIAVDKEGRLFGIVGNEVIQIERFTGQGTVVYQLPSSFNLPGLDFSPDDTLYAAGLIGGQPKLLKIDVEDTSYVEIGNLTYNCPGLCFDESGTLYGSVNLYPDSLTIIDVSTAHQTVVGSIGFWGVCGIDFSPGFRVDIVYSLPYARPGYLTWWKPALVNKGDSPVQIDGVRLDVYGPDVYGPVTKSLTLWSGALTIPPQSQVSRWINVSVPAQTPLGLYLFETVVEYQGHDLASGSFECEVVE